MIERARVMGGDAKRSENKEQFLSALVFWLSCAREKAGKWTNHGTGASICLTLCLTSHSLSHESNSTHAPQLSLLAL